MLITVREPKTAYLPPDGWCHLPGRPLDPSAPGLSTPQPLSLSANSRAFSAV